MRALLDVNVLVALLDGSHQMHRDSRRWLEANVVEGWASCPLTQNGVVRILSLPAYPNCIPASEAIARMRAATDTEHHEFWADDISVLNAAAVRSDRVHGPRQVTDIYLLALAAAHRGRLVTFDSSVPISAAPAATGESLVVL